jgi:hypothetical protein
MSHRPRKAVSPPEWKHEPVDLFDILRADFICWDLVGSEVLKLDRRHFQRLYRRNGYGEVEIPEDRSVEAQSVLPPTLLT